MKNSKIIFLFLFLFLFFFKINSLGEEFKFESSEVQILEKGNLIIVENEVKILSKDNLKIEADKSEYDKKKNSLKVYGNVKITDRTNDIVINAEKVNYLKNDEIIFTEGKSIVELEDKFFINSTDLNLDRKLMKFSSNKKTIIDDTKGYTFILDEFNFDIKNKILIGKNVYLKDIDNNNYFLERLNLNLDSYDFSGEKLYIDFDNSLFGNKENEPRLTGEKITDNKNESAIYKGTFTTCKKNAENCPPWLLSADEIKHKKKEKIIEYRNAWLEIYKKPVIYFPYFYHPDPTVKRQSGFLAPTVINSSVSGTTFKIPYYKVISEDKDLTISPQIFFDKSVIFQTEYRQAYKNSKSITDLSLAKDENETKAHFFSNIKGNKNSFEYEINLEKVSNDKFLKVNKITSPLINSYSELNSFIKFDKSSENSFLSSSIEIFEDLNKKNSDRYEYVLPNISYSKSLGTFENSGSLEYKGHIFQKYFNTNHYEGSFINDLIFKSNKKISKNGFINSYSLLFRNANSDLRNSLEFENSENFDLLSTLLFESKLPLRKIYENKTSLITPIISARFSPNKTKNIKNLDSKISYSNIYSLDRLGQNDMVEGRYSLTLGNEYSILDKNDKEIFNLSVANVLRNTHDDDLPIKSTLGDKRSNIFGLLKYMPSDNFDIEYQFSLDNDLKYSNSDIIKSNFKINNFITSFEYFEEDNIIGNKSYITNTTEYNIDKNKSMSFEISKNLDKNITDYYNLIYEYKNDCMTAALEYNKTFYDADDLESDQNIFFTIKIIPFGKISSPSIN